MGRPGLLTSELAAEIVRNLASGAFIDEAAGAAGIDDSTLYKWLARGRKAKAEPDEATPDDALYIELVDATTRARHSARVQAHATLRANFARGTDKGDWRAAEAYLKLVDPKRYRNRVEITGAGGGPVEMDLAFSARQQINERLGDMRLRAIPAESAPLEGEPEEEPPALEA